ncbi:hypothetical protein B0H34DRAFT_685136 [Crassisporium funariophilum]|nr:hypothetical protein B0H34DRAFT_685136 [Crassisporium funariophilum]
MSNKRRDPLPRLSIAPNINMQQPMGGGGMYSPALPTSLQQSFHPAFPMNSSLQTPMQAFFNAQPPPAPGRPAHHQHQASMQLAAAGIHPPNFMTPVATHFPRPSMMLGPGGQPQAPSHPFPNRNRRQLSIGGPPKAVLGGPARKLSPLPATATPTAATSVTPQKAKKVTVNLPKETIAGEDGKPATRTSWARTPLDDTFEYKDKPIIPVELSTTELFPPDAWRLRLPNSIDVYLPGKGAWDTMKQKVIEEKLERLGVERGSGSNVPHIHAPRAASISSPADPALLLFKLNKLHQAQEGSSAGNSLSVSPQPPFSAPFGLSPSPHRGMRFITNRHGHSMSLAQPPSYQSSSYSASTSPFNPFGPGAVLGSDSGHEYFESQPRADGIHAPQGRIPMTAPDFVPPPLSAVGNANHVDFIRGFGLDVPVEEEVDENDMNEDEQDASDEDDGDATQDMELEEKYGGEIMELDDGTTTAPQSRLHSRHVSRLSATLSLRSVGGNFTSHFQGAPEESEGEQQDLEEDFERPQNPHLEDAVEEWTGSEDVYLGIETSDDESLGEWSNPSDEERARQQRVERRMRRKAAQKQHADQPRRLPNFPRPPENTLAFHDRREDDIISNPSEENMVLARRGEFLGVRTEEYYEDSTSGVDPLSPRLLPPLPHSRVASGQYSAHDPAMAHSRGASENYMFASSPFDQSQFHQSQSSSGRRDSLNPFAKPFVFGAPKVSGSFQPFGGQSTPPLASNASRTHSRLPSLGKPLNVAAPEFKPGEFNFRLPSGAPQMPVPMPAPAPEFLHPQVVDPSESAQSTPFKVQGREKRQRRGSSASMEEGDSMHSFRFPMKMDDSPRNIRRTGSFSGVTRHQLNPSAQPFTFAGFSAVANNMPWVPKESDGMEMPEPDLASVDNSGTAKADNSEVLAEEISLPTTTRSKRAPIPLDFKHPVSGNTVPAGLFKALVNSGEERTRRGVRSRLSSREIFEHQHRPSMDDNDVALIAHKNTPRSRLVTDPGERPSPSAHDDVFGSVRHTRRRSSLPDALHDNDSSPSENSVAPQDLSARMELHHLENVIRQLLDEQLGPLRHDIAKRVQNGGQALSSSTEATMNDVISLFRAQLQESATRSLEDSQMDARGELDFQMIREIVDEGYKNMLSAFQREMHRLAQQLPNGHAISNLPQELLPVLDQVGSRTINAVVEAISELSARQEAMSLNAPARERDLIVDKLVTVLTPMMHSIRAEPIDYEFLTRELTQAVKPHISQLIDLASDKRETAGLIVDRILPLITSKMAAIDTDAITLKLITEVRRAIAPIDAFEIKEQVADLVVERLDSRLAVRDKAFNVDVVTTKVTENIAHLLEALNTVPSTLSQLASAQKAVGERQDGLATSQCQILTSISNIPGQVDSQLESLKTMQGIILTKLDKPTISAPATDGNVILVKDIVEALAPGHKTLAGHNEELLTQNKALLDKLDTLPAEFSGIALGLQNTIVELITTRDNSKREMDELRKLNTDFQIQVTKARGLHGQVRVEKDMLNEKLGILEGDRDRLRVQVKELQATASAKTTETAALEARNTELEEALAKALARLQSSDVAAQANQRSIADLENANKDLTAEKESLKSKVNALTADITFAAREKEATAKAFEVLQKERDVLSSQQANWDVLHAATEKINMVYKLLENADDEEQQELRHHRDRAKALEGENVTLQKRFKDLEAKVANSDRNAATARQSLTQAQQRSTEWERRAKDYEGQLELVQTKLDQAEQTQSQLDADYSMVRLQLEEQEADGRLVQDQENKLRDQITALETKCSLLQTELEKARAAKAVVAAVPPPNHHRPYTNGNSHPPPRPDSRASTIDGRDNAPSRRIPSYSTTQRSTVTSPEASVWDSMHAPAQTNGQSKWAGSPKTHATPSRYSNITPSTPRAQPSRYNSSSYVRGPSPTPSTVSAAPTVGDDGWWS